MLKFKMFIAILIFSALFTEITSALTLEKVHANFDWEDDDPDVDNVTEPLPPYESCVACHNGTSYWEGAPSVLCEDCHIVGGVGPWAAYFNFNLRDDYTLLDVIEVYEHIPSGLYDGTEVFVPSQRNVRGGGSFSRCYDFNIATGQGTCHGISYQNQVDEKFAFNFTGKFAKCEPNLWTSQKGYLPATSDCLYCHLQSDPAIVGAWANPTQVLDHENAITNNDCYKCHVEGGLTPTTFHAMSLEGPPAGGETVVTPPTPLLQGGINILTADLYREIILGLGLRYKPFFKSPDTLVASLIMTGKYPKPTYPDATRALGKPIEKIYGDVYELAASKTMERYVHTNTLVIARGDIPVDSMAAIAYAKSKDIPILLTKPGVLPSQSLEAINKLKPTKIVIIGGPVAVSEGVEAELAKIAEVERIWGQSRCETAVEVAKVIDNPDTIVITDAEHPSTDAAFIAATFDAPLLYVNLTDIPQAAEDFLQQHKTTKNNETVKVVIAGVSNETTSKIEGVIR